MTSDAEAILKALGDAGGEASTFTIGVMTRINPASVYIAGEELEDAGLIILQFGTKYYAKRGNRRRVYFHLTNLGREQLGKWE
jgi:DNA-binding PadR family transcriptional regulator